MKIAVTNAFLPSDQQSGVPLQVHRLANTLVSRGHDVMVYSFSAKPADAQYNVHAFARPPIPRRFWPFVMALQLARTDFSAFDVLHVSGDNYLLRRDQPHVRTFYGAALEEMRHAVTFRSRAFFFVTTFLESIGERKATISIGISETTRSSFKTIKKTIPCGVDLELFKPRHKSTNPTVFFAGTEFGRKRGAWLAEIFKNNVLPRVPGAELIMATDSVSDEFGIRRLGRVSNSQIIEEFGEAWLFCLPSTYEGFGVPYIEAMASKTAVVATSQNPGAAEVLGNGQYGAFVSDEELSDTIVSLLTNAQRRQHYENVGLNRSRDFAWNKIASAYEDVYLSLVAMKTNA